MSRLRVRRQLVGSAASCGDDAAVPSLWWWATCPSALVRAVAPVTSALDRAGPSEAMPRRRTINSIPCSLVSARADGVERPVEVASGGERGGEKGRRDERLASRIPEKRRTGCLPAHPRRLVWCLTAPSGRVTAGSPSVWVDRGGVWEVV